jgi:hypothetical protein
MTWDSDACGGDKDADVTSGLGQLLFRSRMLDHPVVKNLDFLTPNQLQL